MNNINTGYHKKIRHEKIAEHALAIYLKFSILNYWVAAVLTLLYFNI